MKRIFLPLVLGLALVSCTRNNDDFTQVVEEVVANNEITPVEEKVFLTKFREEGGYNEWHFTYDENQNRIASISFHDDEGEFATRTFTYNANDQIVSSLYEDSLYGEKIENTYSYDAEGRLVSFVSVSVDEYGTDTTTITYDYSTIGKIAVNKSVSDSYGDITDTNYTLNLNEKGQVIEKTSIAVDGVINRDTYTYNDVNKTPFSNVRGLSALMLVEVFDVVHKSQVEGLGVISNITSIKEEVIGEYGTIETNTTNDWVYNENNYPTKRVESRVRVGSNTNLPAKTYIYEYNQ